MTIAWSPRLRVGEVGGRCRLHLEGIASGEGASLQEAADDLVARLLRLAATWCSVGCRFSSELGGPDVRTLEFLRELSELDAAGLDIRGRVFAGHDPR